MIQKLSIDSSSGPWIFGLIVKVFYKITKRKKSHLSANHREIASFDMWRMDVVAPARAIPQSNACWVQQDGVRVSIHVLILWVVEGLVGVVALVVVQIVDEPDPCASEASLLDEYWKKWEWEILFVWLI
jgi:hypothetical protein